MKKRVLWSVVIVIFFRLTTFGLEEEIIDDHDLFENTLYGETLKAYGLIEGNGQGLNEEGPITREAFIKMLVLISTDMTEPFDLPAQPSFSDVTSDHWAYDWVERAYAAGLTRGIGNGAFGLGQEVTKQQVAAFMLNALGDTYDYSSVVESAASRGIESHVEDTFKRANAFEMVYKTLFQAPLGQDERLCENNKNFEGKDFYELAEDIKVSRQAQVKAAREKAAAEALRVEEEKMDEYRSTWPASQETYIAWMMDMTEILEPYWQEIPVSDYMSRFGYSSDYRATGPEGDKYSYIVFGDKSSLMMTHRINDEGKMAVDHITMSDFVIYHVPKYDAYRIEVDHEEHIYSFFFIVDKDEKQRKGYFYYNNELKIIRLNTHSRLQAIKNLSYDLRQRNENEAFTEIFLDELTDIIHDPITFDGITNRIDVREGIDCQTLVGFNTYTVHFNNFESKGRDVYFEIDDHDADETNKFRVFRIYQNDQKDIIRLDYIWDKSKYVHHIFIQLNGDGEVLSIYLDYPDGEGIYLVE